MVARSFIAETRSIELIHVILSGLLDGLESAKRTDMIFMSKTRPEEELERIRRRYEEKTGEPLLLTYRGEINKLGRGKIAVMIDPTPGRTTYGIVVSDFVIDNRMVDYIERYNMVYEPLDQSPRGGTKVIDTRFGKIELAIPRRETNWQEIGWPRAPPAAGRGDTEAWMFDRPYEEPQTWRFMPTPSAPGLPVTPLGRLGDPEQLHEWATKGANK